jgi:hypothetical protein
MTCPYSESTATTERADRTDFGVCPAKISPPWLWTSHLPSAVIGRNDYPSLGAKPW